MVFCKHENKSAVERLLLALNVCTSIDLVYSQNLWPKFLKMYLVARDTH